MEEADSRYYVYRIVWNLSFLKMDVIERNLMTARKFEQKTKGWTVHVRNVSRAVLSHGTHAAGELGKTLTFRLRYEKEYLWVNAVGFHFNRYGAFREYGAGRGYVVHNGIIRRGRRLWNIARKEYNDETAASVLAGRGYTSRELKDYKMIDDRSPIQRRPLSWFDKPVSDNIHELGDIAAEFYGDQALRDVLAQINNLTIRKNYGEVK